MAGKVKTIEVYYWIPSDWTTDKSEADLQAELEGEPYSTTTVGADATHAEISDWIRVLMVWEAA